MNSVRTITYSTSGFTGPTGSNGQNGTIGPTGPNGINGTPGSTGPTGPVGSNGQKFNTFTTSSGNSTPSPVTPSPTLGGTFDCYVEGNLAYVPGNSVVVVNSVNSNVKFEGYVTTYTNYITYGYILISNIQNITGSFTTQVYNINLDGVDGPTGSTGPTGATGVSYLFSPTQNVSTPTVNSLLKIANNGSVDKILSNPVYNQLAFTFRANFPTPNFQQIGILQSPYTQDLQYGLLFHINGYVYITENGSANYGMPYVSGSYYTIQVTELGVSYFINGTLWRSTTAPSSSAFFKARFDLYNINDSVDNISYNYFIPGATGSTGSTGSIGSTGVDGPTGPTGPAPNTLPVSGSIYQTSLAIYVPDVNPVTILSFTLPSAGSWDVTYWMRAQTQTQIPFAGECALYDNTDTKVPNSEILSYYNTGSYNQSATGNGRIILTTTGSSTYTMKAFASTGSFSSYSDPNGRTGVTYVQLTGGYIGATGPTGPSASPNLISAYVNAGSFVTMDNLMATVTTSGNRGLALKTSSGTMTACISGTFGAAIGTGGYASAAVSITTSTGNSSIFTWNFLGEGDCATYIVNNYTKVYRITTMIGGGFNNNFICMERLN